MNKVPHPCVCPRRRFVLAFLGVCMLLVLVDFARIGTFKLDFYGVFLVEVLLLALPSRTSHGTLMQLVGLVMPFSAVAILLFCGMEEMGMCFPRWMHMVMTPLALIFWVGGVLYSFVWALLALWRGLVAQKMQK